MVAPIIEALDIAVFGGLRLPLVYNTGGYDSLEALSLLDGIIDIYMPDMKYGNSAMARRYSRVPDYVEINEKAVKEMHRQVGDLVLGPDGLAVRGLLIRHLVLQGDLSGTGQVLAFIAKEISSRAYVNLMDQYRPCFRADNHPLLDLPLSRREYQKAIETAHHLGLTRLD